MAGSSSNQERPNGSAVYQVGVSLWLTFLAIRDTPMAKTSSNDECLNGPAVYQGESYIAIRNILMAV